jgi:RNA recognition motif-containing protein
MAELILESLMNIYVGNLPYSTTEDELKALFAEYGEVVSATIITDRFSGRSKGFGFVEMAVQREGETAIAALDGSMLNGRNLRVNMARPRTERPKRRDDDWY